MGEMIKYVKSQGIEHNPTAGYSPESNSVAERMNRTSFDKACTMLDSSGASLELWGEAVLAATHIRNRLPTSTLDGKTPHEAWTGKKPMIRDIRKWGCKVYRHINKKTGRKKPDKKSMIGFLVGYESGNIYCIYHPTTKEFKVSRDVIFSENQFFGSRHMTSIDERDHRSELEILDTRSEIDMEIPVDNDGSEAEGEPHDENPTPHQLSMMKSLFNHYRQLKGQLRATCQFKGQSRVKDHPRVTRESLRSQESIQSQESLESQESIKSQSH
jgi:hypothetical protein